MANITPGYETLTKKEFDELAKQPELWREGPEIEKWYYCSPPDDIPDDLTCEVRGILKTGRKIRAEV